MYHDFNYEATLSSSLRAQWHLDDVLRPDQQLDFSLNFMPDSLARTAALEELNPFEQRVLNQISAHQYLSIFGIVEEFILPFLMDHARPIFATTTGGFVRSSISRARKRSTSTCSSASTKRSSAAFPSSARLSARPRESAQRCSATIRSRSGS